MKTDRSSIFRSRGSSSRCMFEKRPSAEASTAAAIAAAPKIATPVASTSRDNAIIISSRPSPNKRTSSPPQSSSTSSITSDSGTPSSPIPTASTAASTSTVAPYNDIPATATATASPPPSLPPSESRQRSRTMEVRQRVGPIMDRMKKSLVKIQRLEDAILQKQSTSLRGPLAVISEEKPLSERAIKRRAANEAPQTRRDALMKQSMDMLKNKLGMLQQMEVSIAESEDRTVQLRDMVTRQVKLAEEHTTSQIELVQARDVQEELVHKLEDISDKHERSLVSKDVLIDQLERQLRVFQNAERRWNQQQAEWKVQLERQEEEWKTELEEKDELLEKETKRANDLQLQVDLLTKQCQYHQEQLMEQEQHQRNLDSVNGIHHQQRFSHQHDDDDEMLLRHPYPIKTQLSNLTDTTSETPFSVSTSDFSKRSTPSLHGPKKSSPIVRRLFGKKKSKAKKDAAIQRELYHHDEDGNSSFDDSNSHVSCNSLPYYEHGSISMNHPHHHPPHYQYFHRHPSENSNAHHSLVSLRHHDEPSSFDSSEYHSDPHFDSQELLEAALEDNYQQEDRLRMMQEVSSDIIQSIETEDLSIGMEDSIMEMEDLTIEMEDPTITTAAPVSPLSQQREEVEEEQLEPQPQQWEIDEEQFEPQRKEEVEAEQLEAQPQQWEQEEQPEPQQQEAEVQEHVEPQQLQQEVQELQPQQYQQEEQEKEQPELQQQQHQQQEKGMVEEHSEPQQPQEEQVIAKKQPEPQQQPSFFRQLLQTTDAYQVKLLLEGKQRIVKQ